LLREPTLQRLDIPLDPLPLPPHATAMTADPRTLLHGVVHARALSGDGGGTAVDPPFAHWLHLDATKPDSVH